MDQDVDEREIWGRRNNENKLRKKVTTLGEEVEGTGRR